MVIKATWIGALVATSIFAGCSRVEQMPESPYDLPGPGEKDVVDVNLVEAKLGHAVDARRPSDNAAYTIYLADVIAPAKGQAWHVESIEALDAMVKGKSARLRIYEALAPPDDSPDIGVTVFGRLYVDRKDLSWELVGTGNVWVWDSKSNDPELKKLEAWARKHQKGLWALPESEREPPWEFMRRQVELRMQNREKVTPN